MRIVGERDSGRRIRVVVLDDLPGFRAGCSVCRRHADAARIGLFLEQAIRIVFERRRAGLRQCLARRPAQRIEGPCSRLAGLIGCRHFAEHVVRVRRD